MPRGLKWPVASLLSRRTGNDLFHVGSRKLYVDTPIDFYLYFVEYALRLSDHAGQLGRVAIVEEVQRLASSLNRQLRIRGLGWFRVFVRRNPAARGSGAPCLLGYQINWRDFEEFQRRFAERRLPWKGGLAAYYEYINAYYRYPLFEEALSKRSLRAFFKRVSRRVKPWIEGALESARSSLARARSALDAISLGRGPSASVVEPLWPLITATIWELSTGIAALEQLLSQPPLFYTTARRLLEEAASLCGLTVLVERDLSALGGASDPGAALSAINVIIQAWQLESYYKRARETRLVVRYFKERRGSPIASALEALHGVLGESLETIGLRGPSKSRLSDMLWESASASLIAILPALSQTHSSPGGGEAEEAGEAPIGVRDVLDTIRRARILDALASLASRSLAAAIAIHEGLAPTQAQSLAAALERKLKEKLAQTGAAYPGLPGYQLLLETAARQTGLPLREMYDDYSGFTHASPALQAVPPYTSILEYSLLAREAQRIAQTLVALTYCASGLREPAPPANPAATYSASEGR